LYYYVIIPILKKHKRPNSLKTKTETTIQSLHTSSQMKIEGITNNQRCVQLYLLIHMDLSVDEVVMPLIKRLNNDRILFREHYFTTNTEKPDKKRLKTIYDQMIKMTKDKQLDDLIEEATIDCYDEYEQLCGFAAILPDKITFPFKAKVVGEDVGVIDIDMAENHIVVVCKRKNKKYTIDLLNVEYRKSDVIGSEWIDAYRKWRK
jgi:hypothetical protein